MVFSTSPKVIGRRHLADFLAIGDLLEPAGCRNPAIARWRSGAALALVHLGRQDEARTLAEEELELSRAWGAPTMIGRSLRALGLVEGGQRGLELLRGRGRACSRQSPAAYELLKTQVELGAALRRANQRAARASCSATASTARSAAERACWPSRRARSCWRRGRARAASSSLALNH